MKNYFYIMQYIKKNDIVLLKVPEGVFKVYRCP